MAAGHVAEIDLICGAELVAEASSRTMGQDQQRLLAWERKLRSPEAQGEAGQVASHAGAVRTALSRLRDDPAPQVRQYAEKALEAMGGSSN